MISKTVFEFKNFKEHLFLRLFPFCSRRKQAALFFKGIFKRNHNGINKSQYSLSFLEEMQKYALQFIPPSNLSSKQPLSVFLFLADRTKEFKIPEDLDKIETKIKRQCEFFVFSSVPGSHKVLADSRIINIFADGKDVKVTESINKAISMVRGSYILFLNAEIAMLDLSAELLISELDAHNDIYAVSGKIISYDQRIISAGAKIGHGCKIIPSGFRQWFLAPEFSFRSHVTVPSKDLFLVRKDKIIEYSHFDTNYLSFSYSLADFCLRINKHGERILLQPYAVGLCNGSYRQKIRSSKDKSMLISRLKETKSTAKQPTILIIDDKIPDPALGAGAPRSFEILRTLIKLHYSIAFFPVKYSIEHFKTVLKLQQLNVEMVYGKNPKGEILLSPFLKKRKNGFDIVIISRPFIMESIGNTIIRNSGKAFIIYDAEAIYCIRTINFLKLLNVPWLTPKLINRLISKEVKVSDKADVVITVSKIEADEFLKRGIKNVNIVAHSVNNKLSNNSFSCRKNILFVGGICESPSPNEDAILYFCSHILPIILQKIDLQLCIVGTNKSNAVWRLASPKISVIGRVEDLSTYFNSFKIFIAPSRYAAGIPLKVCEAASYGIPCVITPLLAKQLEWSNGAEALVGKNATHFAQQCIRLYSHEKLWHSIRENAYGIVSKEYSSFVFEKRVSRICAAGQVHLQRKY